MNLYRTRKAVIGLSVVAVIAGTAFVSGCAPRVNTEASPITPNDQVEQLASPVFNPEGPVVVQTADGRLIQRTPDSSDLFNVDILKGDMRGCYACHGNLNELVLEMYPQHNPSQGLHGVNPSISQCLDCHNRASYAGNLGSMIHSIHSVGTVASAVECFQCHDTQVDGGMALWDQTKFSEFHGITSVEDAEQNGSFQWDQDYTVSQDEMPNAQWMSNEYDEMRFENTANDVPLDQEMFDTWEITVSGEVEQEQTWLLKDLIAEAEAAGVIQTTPLVAQCTINPLGGEAIAQVEVTGIPLDWILDKVQLTDAARSFSWYSPDGVKAGYRGVNFDELPGHVCLLAYEFNGEPLSWNNGYPCMLWIGGFCADHLSKNFSELQISADDQSLGAPGVPFPGEGTLQGSGKPNLGFMNTLEGQIIQVGQPYTFEGWANGFDVNVVALEFSMDGGETWARCDTPDPDINRWVHWQYTWTPSAENGDTAYVLQARAIAEDGRVTPTPISVMVNAKTTMPEPTVIEEA